jgi:hypothetical protein
MLLLHPTLTPPRSLENAIDNHVHNSHNPVEESVEFTNLYANAEKNSSSPIQDQGDIDDSGGRSQEDSASQPDDHAKASNSDPTCLRGGGGGLMPCHLLAHVLPWMRLDHL